MHYEINVSQHGHHVFATHPRSLTTLDQAAKVYGMLTRAFPASEGFIITATHQYEVCKRCTEDAAAAHRLATLAKEGTS
jgi:hypothetical protein